MCSLLLQGKFLRLRDEVMRHRPAVCSFELFGIGGALKLAVCIFVVPRPGNQRVWWHLKDIYTVGKFDVFSGASSKWIFNMVDSWRAMFIEAFGCDQVVYGFQHSDESNHRNALGDDQKCLGESSVSTVGWLLLLLRWGYKVPRSGGLRAPSAAEAARTMLSSVLNCIVQLTELKIPIAVAVNWLPVWPRPEPRPDGRAWVYITINQGILDFGELSVAGARPDRMAAAHTWHRALTSVFGKATSCPLVHFLSSASHSKHLSGLVNQLLVALVVVLEKTLGRVAQEGSMDKDLGLEVLWKDAEVPKGGQEMEAKLAHYVLNCKWKSEGQDVIGISTDEGMVKGIPLQNSVICLPNNVCMLACPQVVPHLHKTRHCYPRGWHWGCKCPSGPGPGGLVYIVGLP